MSTDNQELENQEPEALRQLADDRKWFCEVYSYWASNQKLEKRKGRRPKRFTPEMLFKVYMQAAEGKSVQEIVDSIKLSKTAFYRIIQAQVFSPDGELLKQAFERGRALSKSKVGYLIARHHLLYVHARESLHEKYKTNEVFSPENEDYLPIEINMKALTLLIEYMDLVDGHEIEVKFHR